jgi:uncharacterized protein (TIGR03435 family)
MLSVALGSVALVAQSPLPADLFSALPSQLGLKLESSKAHREVLVIDRLARPSED